MIAIAEKPRDVSSLDRLTRTIVLVEDRRFYRHSGIDFVATLRAIIVNLRERRYAQGGSTITQQLARTLYLDTKKNLKRKIKEAFIALWLEFKLSKTEILDLYLSKVYMGQRGNESSIIGFREAALCYFKKDLEDATVVEQAALIAMLKGPNAYHPRSAKGIARRAMILGVMLDNEEINKEEFFKAIGEEL